MTATAVTRTARPRAPSSVGLSGWLWTAPTTCTSPILEIAWFGRSPAAPCTIAGSTEVFCDYELPLTGPATSTLIEYPRAIAVDNSGDVYVGSYANVQLVSGGQVTLIAGSKGTGSSDGAGDNASFTDISGIRLDGSGRSRCVRPGQQQEPKGHPLHAQRADGREQLRGLRRRLLGSNPDCFEGWCSCAPGSRESRVVAPASIRRQLEQLRRVRQRLCVAERVRPWDVHLRRIRTAFHLSTLAALTSLGACNQNGGGKINPRSSATVATQSATVPRLPTAPT